MSWVIALLAGILFATVAGFLMLNWQIAVVAAETHKHLRRLRIEIAAGLGVNLEDPNGHLDGGHLTYMADDLKSQRRKDREARAADRDLYS